MSLTLGKSPLSNPPGGQYNFDFVSAAPHVLYLESVPKRIRGVLARKIVVDTMHAKMLHESGEFIQWYFPIRDVAADALQRAGSETGDGFKGEVTFYDMHAGETVRTRAAWAYASPPKSASFLEELVAIDFDSLDAWFEEDDQVFGHPRDPYHRFDVRRTSERVRVRVGDTVIAETRRALKLFETSIITRYYIPVEDVVRDALTGSTTRTYCPYKGEATYFHVHAGDRTIEDGAWTLLNPLGEADMVRGYISFWKEGTEITADGRVIPI